MNCFKVLRQFHRIFSFQSTATSCNCYLFNAERHLWEDVVGCIRTKTFCRERVQTTCVVVNAVTSKVRSCGCVTRQVVSCADVDVVSRTTWNSVRRVTKQRVSNCVRTTTCCKTCVCFVIECFCVCVCSSIVTRTHRENKTCWTSHWLDTADVISDQIRHRTAN